MEHAKARSGDTEGSNLNEFRVRREISLSDIIHTILIVAAFIGLALAGEQWKTTVEIQMQQVTTVLQHQSSEITGLGNEFYSIDERLSRMEGQLGTINRQTK